MYPIKVRTNDLLPNIKAWSNFRLMLIVGSVVTVLSLMIGGAYVQSSITAGDSTGETAGEQSGEQSQESDSEPDEPQPPPALSQGSSAVTEVPLPTADSGEGFTVFCPTGHGASTDNTCRVRSYNGFSAPVSLSCEATPPGLGCSFNPPSVTPPPDGRATFNLQIEVSENLAPGGHVFNVTGRSGNLIRSYRYPFSLPPAPLVFPPGQEPTGPAAEAPQAAEEPSLEPTFTIACSLNPSPEIAIDKLLWSLNSGPQGKIKCIVKPVNGFSEPIEMELTNISGNLTSYEFDPPVVQPAPSSPSPDGATVGGSSFVDLTVGLGNFQDAAEYSFDVTGVSESVTTSRRVLLTVTDQG